MIGILRNVMKNLRWPIQHRHNSIHPPIIIQIAHRRTSMRSRHLKTRSSGSRHILKLAIAQVPEHRVRLLILPGRKQRHIVHHIRPCNKQIFPPIVIQIDDRI